jgi:hypothetical protein
MIIICIKFINILISAENQLSLSFFNFLKGCINDALSLKDIANISLTYLIIRFSNNLI